jgi:hypothetical protein
MSNPWQNQTNFALLRLSEQNQITTAHDRKKNTPKKQVASWGHLNYNFINIGY